MSSKFLSVLAGVALAASATSAFAFEAVLSSTKALHTHPWHRSGVIEVLPPTSVVNIVGARRGWAQVQTADGHVGFLYTPVLVGAAVPAPGWWWGWGPWTAPWAPVAAIVGPAPGSCRRPQSAAAAAAPQSGRVGRCSDRCGRWPAPAGSGSRTGRRLRPRPRSISPAFRPARAARHAKGLEAAAVASGHLAFAASALGLSLYSAEAPGAPACIAASARANSAKPAVSISSARRVGSMSAAAKSARGSTPSRFEALAQHLAPLSERGLRDRETSAPVAGQWLFRGTSSTTEEVTFGGGVNARARRRTGCAPSSASRTARRAARSRRAAPAWRRSARPPRAGTSAPDDPKPAARLRSRASASVARSRCCRAGSRNSHGAVGRAVAEQRADAHFERIAFDQCQAAGIMRGDVGERRDAARVAFDRDHALGAFG